MIKIRLLPFIMISLMLSVSPAAAWAAHGCSINEPDRDGDGVPDKSDDFPDDPTLAGLQKGGDEKKLCGEQLPQMKLYFIPFKMVLAHTVTKDSIEKDRIHSLWFCSKNELAQDILNVLEEGAKDESSAIDHELIPEGPSMEDEQKSVPAEPLPPSLLNEEEIRLKVEIPAQKNRKTLYFVDKFGVGEKNLSSFFLSQDQLDRLEKSILKAAGSENSPGETVCVGAGCRVKDSKPKP